jgi:hypothetical protein
MELAHLILDHAKSIENAEIERSTCEIKMLVRYYDTKCFLKVIPSKTRGVTIQFGKLAFRAKTLEQHAKLCNYLLDLIIAKMNGHVRDDSNEGHWPTSNPNLTNLIFCYQISVPGELIADGSCSIPIDANDYERRLQPFKKEILGHLEMLYNLVIL